MGVSLFSWFRSKRRGESEGTRAAVSGLAANVELAQGAEERGSIFRSEYMSKDVEEVAFVLGIDGLPTGWLARERGQLVIFTEQGMVNPSSTRLYRLGVYCFGLRGASYYEDVVTRGDFRPGAPVRLVREPGNAFDANAVAVHPANVDGVAGYVNRLNAKRLAPVLDHGVDMAAVSIDGSGPGVWCVTPRILVANSDVMAHLLRGVQT